MIVRSLILFPLVILSYSNESPREFILPYCYFPLFYDVGVDLDLAWEGDFLKMESKENIQLVSQ